VANPGPTTISADESETNNGTTRRMANSSG
jgi:hypothetical protein